MFSAVNELWSIELFSNVIEFLELKGNFMQIINKNDEKFIENFTGATYYEISQKINSLLVKEYHNLKDNDKLQGRTRAVRLKQFATIIQENSFCLNLFSKYPLLEQSLKSTLKDFFDNIEEILSYYNQKKIEIEDHFQQIFGKIIQINLEMGDKHNGRTVAKVIFENGVLYYKPKPLLSDELWSDLLAFVEKYGKIDFKKIKTLSFQEHSWQENIIHKECQDINQAERYFYRSGVLLALMTTLKSNDMHHENIICHGEYPIIIDTETIATAFLTDNDGIDNGRGLNVSVLNTAMLPTYNSLYDVNMSGLFSSRETSKTIYAYMIEADKDYDIVYKKVLAETTLQPNVVRVGDRVINPDDVENILLDGFEDGCHLIIKNRIEFTRILMNPKYKDIAIRQILRGTQVYYTFLRESLHPSILSDKKNQEKLFDIMYNNFKPSKHGYLRIDKEIEDLKNGNVPLFYTKFTDCNLYSDGEVVCENYYAISPLNASINSLNWLDLDMIEYQKYLIRLSIFTATQKESDYMDAENKAYELKKVVDYSEIVDRHIEKIKKLEVPDNLKGFSTLYMAQTSDDGFDIGTLDPGLYMGGGIVQLLAIYSKNLNDTQNSNFAKRIILSLYEKYKTLLASNNPAEVDYSIYNGLGGLIYLSYNYYKMFQDIEIHNIYKEVLDSFFANYETNPFQEDKDEDFVNGLGGTNFFLGRLYYDCGNQNIQIKIKNFFAKYYLFIKNSALNEVGIAHGISGICVNLSVIYSVLQNDEIPEIIFELLQEEDRLISSKIKENTIQYTWCRGLVGISLSRILINENISDNKKLNEYLMSATSKYISVDNIEKMFSLKNPCLCHGIYGNLDSMKYIDKHISIPNFNRYKEINYLTEDELHNINWFNNSTYPFESFMIGLNGVMYGLLHQTELNIPSITALEIYKDTRSDLH